MLMRSVTVNRDCSQTRKQVARCTIVDHATKASSWLGLEGKDAKWLIASKMHFETDLINGLVS